jgi:UDP-N-acetyl-D-mannosaminuronic acid transferase (WecB/TagA/CpsF family)
VRPSASDRTPGASAGTVRPHAIDILGVPIDDVTYAEALALIEQYIAEGGPHIVTTPNP